jgi:exopolysaccharide production protein ExoQ
MRYIGLLMIPAALYVLWESESKTALGFAFITPVLAVAFFLAKRYLRIALPVTLVLAFVFMLALVAVLSWTGFTVGDVSVFITGDPTFTGRTDIWSFAFDRIAERPLFGYGFHSFWQIGDVSPALRGPPGFLHVAPNGHNGYIDLMLQVGFLGFALFLVLLLAVAGRVSRLIDAKPWLGLFCTSLLVFVILHNLLESTWFEILDINLILFLTLMFTAIGDREVFG